MKKIFQLIFIPAILLAISPALSALPAQAANACDASSKVCNFGSVDPSAGVQTMTITFTNDNGGSSVVYLPSVQNPTNSAFTQSGCSGVALQNGQSCSININFNPSNLSGTVSAQVDIDYQISNTEGNPQGQDTQTYTLQASVASSNTSTSNPSSPSTTPGNGCSNGVVDIGAVSGVFHAQYCSATEAITTAIKWIMMLIGLVAALYIVWGGFQYITSAGNSEKAEHGQKTLTNAAIGLAIAILAYTIVAIISNTLANGK